MSIFVRTKRYFYCSWNSIFVQAFRFKKIIRKDYPKKIANTRVRTKTNFHIHTTNRFVRTYVRIKFCALPALILIHSSLYLLIFFWCFFILIEIKIQVWKWFDLNVTTGPWILYFAHYSNISFITRKKRVQKFYMFR